VGPPGVLIHAYRRGCPVSADARAACAAQADRVVFLDLGGRGSALAACHAMSMWAS